MTPHGTMASRYSARPKRPDGRVGLNVNTMISDVLDNADLSRTARFAKFLREAVAMKTKRVLEVQKYPHVVWFGELPRDLTEIRSPLFAEKWADSDVSWLKVTRPQEPERPV